MRRFLAAVRFLTVIPIPGTWGASEEDLAGAHAYFPVVGLLIGALAAALAAGVAAVLPPLPAAAIIVTALIAVSGGLHVDGLADSADGLLSSRPRARILEIMKDSRIGAMGAVAIACVLLVKFSALASLTPGLLWKAAFLMPLCGRGALVVTMALLPYARAEEGLASAFYKRRPKFPDVALALLVLAAAAWFLSRWAGLAAAGASVVAVLVFSAYTYRKIAGATGDTLGAACEIAEVVPALVLSGWSFCAGWQSVAP